MFHFKEAFIEVVNNQTEHQSKGRSGGSTLCGPSKPTRLLLLPESGLDRLESCWPITDISLNNTKSIAQVVMYMSLPTTQPLLYFSFVFHYVRSTVVYHFHLSFAFCSFHLESVLISEPCAGGVCVTEGCTFLHT